MAPTVTVPNIRLLRVEFAGIRKKIESITDPSEKNLNLLITKKTNLGNLRDRIQRIPTETQSSDFEELMKEILDSMWSIEETESDWKAELKLDSVPSPPISPPKPKKSKLEEFKELIKDRNIPADVTAEVSSIITVLETKVKTVKSGLRVANAKLSARPLYQISMEQAIPPWLIVKAYLSDLEKWILTLYFNLTPAASIIRKRFDSYRCINVVRIASALVKFYSTVSAKIAHDDDPKVCEIQSQQWISIFEKIGYDDPMNRMIIEKALQPINPNDMASNAIVFKGGYYLLYVNHSTFDLKWNDEEDVRKQIKELIKDIGCTLGQLYFMHGRDKLCNGLYIQIFGTEEEADKVQEKLKQHNTPDKKVYTRKHFVDTQS